MLTVLGAVENRGAALGYKGWVSADAVNSAIRSYRDARRGADELRSRRVRIPNHLRSRDSLEPASVAYWCYFLCIDCGYLVDPPPLDPMRTTDATTAPTPHCPACGGSACVDLRQTELVHSLRAADAFEAPQREVGLLRGSNRSTLATLLVGVSLSAILGIMTIEFYSFGLIVPFYLSAIVFGLGAVATVTSVWRSSVDARPLDRPARWRKAIPAGSFEREVHGVVQPAGEGLSAPLTGRSCVGYELAIRADDDADAAAETWLMLEQRVCDLQIGDETVPGDRVELDVSRESFDTESRETSQLDEALRRRGFFSTDAIYIYESVVAAGEPVAVAPGRSGLARLRRLRALTTPTSRVAR